MELGYGCMYLLYVALTHTNYTHEVSAYDPSIPAPWKLGSLWPATGRVHPRYDQAVRGEGPVGNIPWFSTELDSILSTMQRVLAGAGSRARRNDISIDFGVLTLCERRYPHCGESLSPRPWGTTYSKGNIMLWMAGCYGKAEEYTWIGWIRSSIKFFAIHKLSETPKLSFRDHTIECLAMSVQPISSHFDRS